MYLMELYLPLKVGSSIIPIQLHTGHTAQIGALKHLSYIGSQ